MTLSPALSVCVPAVGASVAAAAIVTAPPRVLVPPKSSVPVFTLMVPVVVIYALVTFSTQYVSWYGIWSLYEQHAFLLPDQETYWADCC